MLTGNTTSINILPFRARKAKLITARSHLIDRFKPDCEIIELPETIVKGGTFRLGAIEDHLFAPQSANGFRAKLVSAIQSTRHIGDQIIFDFRMGHPQNWAHFLNNHLPIFFRISSRLDLDWEQVLLLLPKNTPSYICAAASMFGLSVLKTDQPIRGRGVTIDVDPWTAVRAIRADWVRSANLGKILTTSISNEVTIPSHVFLSRRDTRTLSNASEVESFLETRGYSTFYPEDLSVLDQIRLFQEAHTIVAIHGAGLAPLLYRPEDGNLKRIVEILPCGHMTNVFRVMAEQVGCSWIGVRGKIKPEYVDLAYNLKEPFLAFSLDEFEVDIASLELAFSILDAEE